MIKNSFLETSKQCNLLNPLDRIVVAVSGGPDSMALLYLLNESRIELGIILIVAHLNHALRNKASDLDEKLVRQTALNLSLDFYSEKTVWLDHKKFAKKYPSEERLRSIRYEFLLRVAKKTKAKKIALAHTLDDQAETVLMRIIRGTGLYGLGAILPKREVKGFTLIRPLINTERKDIMAYLQQKKIKYRIDKTNFKKTYLRNKIRIDLLKELHQINPNIKQTLGHFAQQAVVDYDYLYKQARQWYEKQKKDNIVSLRGAQRRSSLLKDCFAKNARNDTSIKINLNKFSQLHLSLQRMVIRYILEKISGDMKTFTYKHWEEIEKLIAHKPYGSIVDITKKIKIQKIKPGLLIIQ